MSDDDLGDAGAVVYAELAPLMGEDIGALVVRLLCWDRNHDVLGVA